MSGRECVHSNSLTRSPVAKMNFNQLNQREIMLLFVTFNDDDDDAMTTATIERKHTS